LARHCARKQCAAIDSVTYTALGRSPETHLPYQCFLPPAGGLRSWNEFDIIDIERSVTMSDLLIRNMTSGMKRQIQERARIHRRSLSEEAKLLLHKALATPELEQNMGDWLTGLVRPEDRGDDLVFEYRGNFPKPLDFE
jgi:plasmid stability protein